MIVVRVELHSARTHQVTELARAEICNDETGTPSRRNYIMRTLRGRRKATLDRRETQRQGSLKDWPSEQVHIWNLVAAVLASLGYGGKRIRRSESPTPAGQEAGTSRKETGSGNREKTAMISNGREGAATLASSSERCGFPDCNFPCVNCPGAP